MDTIQISELTATGVLCIAFWFLLKRSAKTQDEIINKIANLSLWLKRICIMLSAIKMDLLLYAATEINSSLGEGEIAQRALVRYEKAVSTNEDIVDQLKSCE